MSDINVSVRYYGVLQHYTGTKGIEITLPAGTTILGLLHHLLEQAPQAFSSAFGVGDIREAPLRIFHNERLVANDGFEEEIADGDKFMLIPAISGGEHPGL